MAVKPVIFDKAEEMDPIGKTALWNESVEELAERWVRANPAEASRQGLSAATLGQRVRLRSQEIRQKAGLDPAKPITNSRQWETQWDAEAAERKLRAAFRRTGWEVAVVDRPVSSPVELARSSDSEADTVVVEADAPQDVARNYQRAGLILPLTAKDALALVLARELFYTLAGSDGSGIVDQIAPDLFAQEVLGWPFCPWAITYS